MTRPQKALGLAIVFIALVLFAATDVCGSRSSTQSLIHDVVPHAASQAVPTK